jgi:hypothetical protein
MKAVLTSPVAHNVYVDGTWFAEVLAFDEDEAVEQLTERMVYPPSVVFTAELVEDSGEDIADGYPRSLYGN